MQPKLQICTLLRVEELAQLIHKSVSSVRSDAARNPHALPPVCRLPGTKRLLWRDEDVRRWLADHVVLPPSSPTEPKHGLSTAKRRRGRPTKAEQLRRRSEREAK